MLDYQMSRVHVDVAMPMRASSGSPSEVSSCPTCARPIMGPRVRCLFRWSRTTPSMPTRAIITTMWSRTTPRTSRWPTSETLAAKEGEGDPLSPAAPPFWMGRFLYLVRPRSYTGYSFNLAIRNSLSAVIALRMEVPTASTRARK
jgi:hypothetical protein